jgi:hypothetical protein
MYAHLTALYCLFVVGLSAAQPGEPQQAQLDVYLKGHPGDLSASPPAAAFTAMTLELDSLLLPANVHVVIHSIHSGNSTVSVPDPDYLKQVVVQVDFRGACEVPAVDAGMERIQTAVPLASTNVVNGKVLPFSWVDCDVLNLFVAPLLAKMEASVRVPAYGRAVARLLAHEFYHVLAQSELHQQSGVAKPRVSAEDLLAARFTFDDATIAKLTLVETGESALQSDTFGIMPSESASLQSSPSQTTSVESAAGGGR